MTDEQVARREQILAAALTEFAAKGFRGATIKSIAAAAGLQSPTLIYWYFPTKEALFRAVIEEQSPLLQRSAAPAELMDLTPEALLAQVARGYIGGMASPKAQQMARVILVELLQGGELASVMGDHFIPRVLNFLRAYLERQIALGRLRPHDTRASARALLGMCMPQVIGKIAVPALRADGLTDEEHIAAVVEIFLRGLRPEEAGDGRD